MNPKYKNIIHDHKSIVMNATPNNNQPKTMTTTREYIHKILRENKEYLENSRMEFYKIGHDVKIYPLK